MNEKEFRTGIVAEGNEVPILLQRQTQMAQDIREKVAELQKLIDFAAQIDIEVEITTVMRRQADNSYRQQLEVEVTAKL